MHKKIKDIKILGIRGIPAGHGGFETFAERFAPYLVDRGWNVTVYCQEDGRGAPYEDSYKGVRLVHIPVSGSGPMGTIIFDWKSTLHSAASGGLMLVFGYNTAVFSTLYRLKRLSVLMNMDGLEWKRQKWSAIQKGWLYLNERAGSLLSHHMIADHPEIKAHLARRTAGERITVIPYGADFLKDASKEKIKKLGLKPDGYCLVVARPEPENFILEIVSAFSQKKRGLKLVVLGRFEPPLNEYRSKVMEAASSEVIFPGAIYDKDTVAALRFFSRLYIHGHSVGGTNPSLVEALGAGNAVLAHNNRFNRWVAGELAGYFTDEDDCARQLDELLGNDKELTRMRELSVKRYHEDFTWDKILSGYEEVLLKWLK